ncbi:MAG TPA: hypothetical protein VLH86_00620 [Patescibacteria group bacterium]|nr:hypothetical protein [Patescibacteria group bacterium]
MSVERVIGEINEGIITLEEAPVDQLVFTVEDLSLEGLRKTVDGLSMSILEASARMTDALGYEQSVHEKTSEGAGCLLAALLGAEHPEAVAAINGAESMAEHAEAVADMVHEMQHRRKSMAGALANFLTQLAGYEEARAEALAAGNRSRGAREDTVYQARAYADRIS